MARFEAKDNAAANFQNLRCKCLWMFEGGQLDYGSEAAPPAVLELAKKAIPTGFREYKGDVESIAVALEGQVEGER